ncbi:hypothetical protein, partial [Rikenella microfusus]|uniref:hypothetical protein n=1 Tax=Rikenella microfusus TaxID=28139 RepID=UPI003A9449DF
KRQENIFCDFPVARAAVSRSGGPLARDARSRSSQAAPHYKNLRFLLMRFKKIAGLCGASGHSDREFVPLGSAKPIVLN